MSKRSKILAAMRVDKKDKVKLADIDSAATDGVKDKKEARELLAEAAAEIDELQYKLYAEAKRAVLVLFQAMDTGGKDGVVRNVFGALHPAGVQVVSFKRPTPLELAHDYLWRVHARTPGRGEMRIFNRSHYEEVLVHRVHKLIPEDALERRYRQINDFERHLIENDTVILKFFLHISKDEQKRRLESRLKEPDKRWKFETADLAERKLWGKYQEAYQVMLEKCSPDHAPWHIVPADHKWYRDWAVAEIVRDALKKLKPEFPKEQEGLDAIVVE